MPASSPTDAPGLDAPEARAAFLLRLRSRGIQSLAVLRAFERVPRRMFVPHRYLDLAARDLALPIGCGQTLDPPWLVAKMIEALAPEPTHRVLQVGAGTGYATAILAQLAGEVVALERFQSLATAAQRRLADLGVANADMIWGDGLAPEAGSGFDRIIVHGLLTEGSDALVGRLAPGGILVAARPEAAGQAVVRIARYGDIESEVRIAPCLLQPISPGLPSVL